MTRDILSMVVTVGVLVTWFVAPASAQSIDQNFYYKMSTQFRGNGLKLDVFNGGARNNMTCLEQVQDVSGQFGGSGRVLTAPFVCQHFSEAPACVWTFLMVVQITTNHILPTALTSPARFGSHRFQTLRVPFA